MHRWRVLLLVGVMLFGFPFVSYAIVPPDLLFSLGAQLTQFLSLFAIAAASIFASVSLIFRQSLFVFRDHFWPVATLILGLSLLTVVGYSAWSIHTLENQYRDRISSIATTASSSSAHRYYNDSVTLWQTETDALPQAVMLDLNRREVLNGTFEHYYYLTNLGDSNTDHYTYELAATSSPMRTNFLDTFSRTPAADLSVRDTIQGTAVVDGDPLTFTITNPQADFLTRHTDLYTRFHSAATATVQYRGEQFTMQALTEGAYSRDYRTYIYFPGLDRLHATTYQLILWDDDNNFYLLDDTTVHTPNPAYPSHTWVLHKQADSGYSKKAFQATITRPTDDTWQVSLPDIASSTLNLTTTQAHYNRRMDRTHLLLEGTITDDNGTRRISGIGHILE